MTLRREIGAIIGSQLPILKEENVSIASKKSQDRMTAIRIAGLDPQLTLFLYAPTELVINQTRAFAKPSSLPVGLKVVSKNLGGTSFVSSGIHLPGLSEGDNDEAYFDAIGKDGRTISRLNYKLHSGEFIDITSKTVFLHKLPNVPPTLPALESFDIPRPLNTERLLSTLMVAAIDRKPPTINIFDYKMQSSETIMRRVLNRFER